jgi:hypothetical protein
MDSGKHYQLDRGWRRPNEDVTGFPQNSHPLLNTTGNVRESRFYEPWLSRRLAGEQSAPQDFADSSALGRLVHPSRNSKHRPKD